MATIGQAELKTKYPVVEGLAANQKHDGQVSNLNANVETTISEKDKVLL